MTADLSTGACRAGHSRAQQQVSRASARARRLERAPLPAEGDFPWLTHSVATGLTVEQWDDKFFTEYLTENRFAGEMGTNENNIIQVKENLTKKPGDRINYALVNRLTNDAITGRDTMEGNEEDMASRSFEQVVDKRRNARSLRGGRRAVLGDLAAQCRQGTRSRTGR